MTTITTARTTTTRTNTGRTNTGRRARPIAAGIAYVVSWIAGLTCWSANTQVHATGADVLATYAGHEAIASLQFVLTEGLPALALAVVALALASAARQSGATTAARVITGSTVAATAVSLIQCGLGLALTLIVVPAHEASAAGTLFALVSRLDGAKMLLLAAIAAGALLARTTPAHTGTRPIRTRTTAPTQTQSTAGVPTPAAAGAQTSSLARHTAESQSHVPTRHVPTLAADAAISATVRTPNEPDAAGAPSVSGAAGAPNVLGATGALGRVGARPVQVLPRWLDPVAAFTILALIASAIGYLFLLPSFSVAAYVSLPLLLIWVPLVGAMVRLPLVGGTLRRGTIRRPLSV